MVLAKIVYIDRVYVVMCRCTQIIFIVKQKNCMKHYIRAIFQDVAAFDGVTSLNRKNADKLIQIHFFSMKRILNQQIVSKSM